MERYTPMYRVLLNLERRLRWLRPPTHWQDHGNGVSRGHPQMAVASRTDGQESMYAAISSVSRPARQPLRDKTKSMANLSLASLSIATADDCILGTSARL